MTILETFSAQYVSKQWPRSWLIYGGNTQTFTIDFNDTLAGIDSFECQVRNNKIVDQSTSVVSVAAFVDPADDNKLIISASGDNTREISINSIVQGRSPDDSGLSHIYVDAIVSGNKHALIRGQIEVRPLGTGQDESPTSVTFESMLDQLQAVSDSVDELAAQVSTDAQTAASTVSSLNAASGFAFEQLGEVNRSLSANTDVVDVCQVRYADMTDGGAALRKSGVPELDVVLRPQSLLLYDSSNGTLWRVIAGSISSSSVLNFWRTGRDASSITHSNGTVFIGLGSGVATNILGVLVINLITGELARISPAANQTNRGLFIGDSLSQNLPVPWVLDSYLANEIVNDVFATVHKGTPINKKTGLPDPTVYVAHDAGFDILKPNPTLDTLSITKLSRSSEVRKIVANDNYILTALNSFAAASLFKSNVEAGPDIAMRSHLLTNVVTESPLIGQPINTMAICEGDDNDIFIGGVGGLAQLIPSDDGNALWRHKTSTYDTGWCMPNSEVVIAPSIADLSDLVGGTLTNYGSGSDLTVNGTVKRRPTELGADRAEFFGFGDNNNFTHTLSQPIGTGDFYFSVIHSDISAGGIFTLGDRTTDATPPNGIHVHRTSGDALNVYIDNVNYPSSEVLQADNRHYKIDLIRRNSEVFVFVDGRIVNQFTNSSDISDQNLTIGDGFFSSIRDISQFRFSTTVPTIDQVQFMYDQDRPSYRQSSRILLQNGNVINDVKLDGGKTYVAQNGASGDSTITVFDSYGVVDSEISPQAILPAWNDSDVDNLSVNDGHLLAGSDDQGVIARKPSIDAREYLTRVNVLDEFDESEQGTHTLFTDNQTPKIIWRKNVYSGESGTKYGFEIHGKDASGNEICRYSGYYRIHRGVQGDAVELEQVWETITSGGTLVPNISLTSNVLNLLVSGSSSAHVYWLCKITKV